MKRVKNLFAIVLTITLLTGLIYIPAYADTTDIVSFDGSTLTIGETDEAAVANYKALQAVGITPSNNKFYTSAGSTNPNKLYAVSGYSGRTGNIIKLAQVNNTDTSPWGKNLAIATKSITPGETSFTVEMWVLNNNDFNSGITLKKLGGAEKTLYINGSSVKVNNSEKAAITKGTWSKLAISYEPATKTVFYYLNDENIYSETVTSAETNLTITLIAVFPTGSSSSPSSAEVYWDDIRVYNGKPETVSETVYYDYDYTNKTIGANAGYPATGLTSIIAAAGSGADGTQAVITGNSGANWLIDKYKSILSDDFIMETSLKLNGGSSVYFGFRSTEKIDNLNENALFEFRGNKIRAGHKSGTVYNNPTVSYEEDKWYSVTVVYHKESSSFDLYINGEKVYENVATQIDTAKVDRMNIWHAVSPNNSIGIRYIKIYSGDNFDAAGYSVGKLTSKGADTTVEGSKITTSCKTIAELKAQLNGADAAKLYTVAADGVYTEITDNVDNGVLVIQSSNGRTIVYYTIEKATDFKTVFDYSFEDGKGLTLGGNGAITGTCEKDYRYNDTNAFKMAGTGDKFIDITTSLDNSFVLEGNAATSGTFLISAYSGTPLTVKELFRIEAPYIKYGSDRISIDNTYVGNGEWVRFAIVYSKTDDKYDLYINGEKKAELSGVFDGNVVTKLRFYMNVGNAGGYTYLDNIKLTLGSKAEYDAAADLAVIKAKSDKEGIYVYGNKIYTDGKVSDFVEVMGVEYDLTNVGNGDTIVLKNGKTIKEYTIESIPALPLVNEFGIYKESNKANAYAKLYSFDKEKEYTLIIAQYSADEKTLENAVIYKHNNDLTASLDYTDGKVYKAFLWDSTETMSPICSEVKL